MAIIIVLAALTTSAPAAIFASKSKLDAVFPDAIIFILSLRPTPTRALWTILTPSKQIKPKRLLNSTGAAPVPPSAPSTVIKSGVIPVANIALQILRNSAGLPIHNLKPMGLPPLKLRNCSIKLSKSLGDVHSGLIAGEMQS